MSTMVSSSALEKASLLPVVEPRAEAAAENNRLTQAASRRNEIVEYVLLMLSLLLTAAQFFILHTVNGAPQAPAADSAHRALNQLAHGLRISIPASLLTSIILFAIAPYIARPERITLARYTVLLCYLLGSFLGALLI